MMIAYGLIFLLGVMTATLTGLLVAPTIWRKAQSLAKRDYIATIPATANEIRAEFDRVRAEAAMAVRAQEIAAFDAREKAALHQAEAGRRAAEVADLQRQARLLGQTLEERDGEIAALMSAAEANATEKARMQSAMDEMARFTAARAEEIELLKAQVHDLAIAATHSERQRAALQASLERAGAPADASRDPAENNANAAVSRLRAALSARQAPSGGDALAEEANLREQIADIAARMIRVTAMAEGTQSPLHAMMSEAANKTTSVGLHANWKRAEAEGTDSAARPRAMTLAERVRLLAQDEEAARLRAMGRSIPDQTLTLPLPRAENSF